MESFSKQLEPAILPAIRYVRLYQQLQSEQVVFSGKRKPLGRIVCHEHNLFANPQSGYMCDLCGGSDKRRFTCVMACDFDGSLPREGVPGGGSAAEPGLTSARSLWQVLGQRRCSGCSGCGERSDYYSEEHLNAPHNTALGILLSSDHHNASRMCWPEWHSATKHSTSCCSRHVWVLCCDRPRLGTRVHCSDIMSVSARLAKLAGDGPREFDIDAVDEFGDNTVAGRSSGGAVEDEDLEMGAPQYRQVIDMGEDARYEGVPTSRRSLRQQRLGGDSDDGSMSDGSDAGMGSYSSGSESDEETGNSALSSKLASQVATDDIEAELEALESGDQQLLMPKRQESDKDRARDTRHQIVSASCC